MKNSRYYPFERNRFFYGKLLTVRDFDSEQKYFNDKRRLINRLLHGEGVVSGLQVVRVDDKTISVEMGVALDSLGREIVVPSPVTLRLSTIEGFTNNEYAKNVYLCLAYDEKGKEPVHSVANSAVRQEEISEYNRIFESYKLFVREEAPDPTGFQYSHLLKTTSMIYENSQVRIYQQAPRYVNPGESFELTLVVEKTLQTPPIYFEYELDSTHFQLLQQTGEDKLIFSEPLDGEETEYRVKYLFKAGDNVTDPPGYIGIKTGTAKLKIGDQQFDINVAPTNEIEIIEGSIKQKILEDYYQRTLDQALEGSDPCIYLAKISLLQMGSTYMIEQVQNLPFNQYVYNPTALYQLDMFQPKRSATSFLTRTTTEVLDADQEAQFLVEYEEENNQFHFRLGLPQLNRDSEELATGVEEIELKKGKKNKGIFVRNEQKYFTDEIEHGLGTGQVCLVVALEESSKNPISDMLEYSQQIYFGDQDVFKDSEYEPKGSNVSIGTLLYPQKGTFRIGIRVDANSDLAKVKIRWWAFRKQGAELNEIHQGYRQVASSKDEQEKGNK